MAREPAAQRRGSTPRPPRKAARQGTGPRGRHDRAAFLALVVGAAEGLVRSGAPRALGMRPLAAAIGYAPNSIYNAVGDLDQVVFRVNARTFERLYDALSAAVRADAPPRDNALALAEAYLAFVAGDPRVWSLVIEHAPAPGTGLPAWYRDALARPTGLVDAVLSPLLPEVEARERAVAALWAALHGLASLATSGKLAGLTAAPPQVLARLLIERFLDGAGPAGDRFA